jgi:hypothetical protein
MAECSAQLPSRDQASAGQDSFLVAWIAYSVSKSEEDSWATGLMPFRARRPRCSLRQRKPNPQSDTNGSCPNSEARNSIMARTFVGTSRRDG